MVAHRILFFDYIEEGQTGLFAERWQKYTNFQISDFYFNCSQEDFDSVFGCQR